MQEFIFLRNGTALGHQRITIDYLKGQTGLEKIIFCLFGRDSYEVFEKQLKKELFEFDSASVNLSK